MPPTSNTSAPKKPINTDDHSNKKGRETYLTEHDQRRFRIKMLHACRPVRFRRELSVRIDGQVKRSGRIGCIVRERLVALMHSIVQQAVHLRHAAVLHERGDAGGRDAPEALQRWGQSEQVVRGGEEEEEEEGEGEEGEQDAAAAAVWEGEGEGDRHLG
jgi:hypothetical protein